MMLEQNVLKWILQSLSGFQSAGFSFVYCHALVYECENSSLLESAVLLHSVWSLPKFCWSKTFNSSWREWPSLKAGFSWLKVILLIRAKTRLLLFRTDHVPNTEDRHGYFCLKTLHCWCWIKFLCSYSSCSIFEYIGFISFEITFIMSKVLYSYRSQQLCKTTVL